jgi:hypothetical protein
MRIRASLVPNLDHETRQKNLKNTTCAKQESNKILLQGRNKDKPRL